MASEDTTKAKEGDIVTIHWSCLNEQGDVLETSKTAEEPTTFEVGAGDIVGNQLFEAFDEAVRGLTVERLLASRQMEENGMKSSCSKFHEITQRFNEWKEDIRTKVVSMKVSLLSFLMVALHWS